MFGEKRKQLPDVASISIDSFRSHAPFGSEIAEPALDFLRDLGINLELGHSPRLALLSSLFLKATESATADP